MRYAILSDVHANADALRTVLADAADMHAERIVCLGDVLGYGPEPVETLELVYRRAHVCLAGNHDDAVSGRCPADDFTEIAATSVARHRAALSRSAVDWLRHLPHTCEFQAAGNGTAEGSFACAHGEFYDPKGFGYILAPEDAIPSWRERTEPLLFVGHTHKPGVFVLDSDGIPHVREPADFTLEPGKRYLVNVGSVGYPRSGACRSAYCLYDDDVRMVRFRSLPFDIEGYQAKMNGQGLDEAPWIQTRAKERQRGEIRSKESFGKQPVTAPRHIRRKIKRASATSVPQTESVPDGRRYRLGPAFIIGSLLIVLGGVWCTRRLVDTVRAGRDDGESVRQINVPGVIPVRNENGERAFSEALPLSGGWTAKFEHEDLQNVKVDGNTRTGATAFRLVSETNGVIRLAKNITLMSRPERVYYTICLLTTARPGASIPFQFTARITFRDVSGAQVDDSFIRQARRSASGQVKVPPGAETAELQIDCRCEGTYELAVPMFKTEPGGAKAGRSGRR